MMSFDIAFLDVVKVDNDKINVDIVLFELNSCCSDTELCISNLICAHGLESNDVLLSREDIISHLLNGQCASQEKPGCSQIARAVQSPIRMAIMVTEEILARCECKQIQLDDLRMYCSAIGMATTRQPEYAILMQKLKTRCNTLRPLLKCDRLETALNTEGLGKQSLQYLSAQHNLDSNPTHNVDSMQTTIVDHISSGGCKASTSSLCDSIENETLKHIPYLIRAVHLSVDRNLSPGICRLSALMLVLI